MLSSMVREHQNKQLEKKEQQERKRKEAIEAADQLACALVNHLNVGVAQAYLNQKKLDAEAKRLHQGTLEFSKMTQQWLTLVEQYSSALKEIGDVENWARIIEDDVKVINDALDNAYKAAQQIPHS